MPSQVIRRHAYRPRERELEILFTSGRCYIFHDVPAEAAQAFRSAFSKGRHFSLRIRDRYRYTQRDGCDSKPVHE